MAERSEGGERPASQSGVGPNTNVALLLDELECLEAPASSGKPLEFPLASIEEDPDQPRRAFDAETLEEHAASIRERGVLQPIGITPAAPNGIHRIAFGRRRFRAARRASRAPMPAFIHSGEISDPYNQVIENIQRDDPSAADIAAFIASRLAVGEKQEDIALRLGNGQEFLSVEAAHEPQWCAGRAAPQIPITMTAARLEPAK